MGSNKILNGIPLSPQTIFAIAAVFLVGSAAILPKDATSRTRFLGIVSICVTIGIMVYKDRIKDSKDKREEHKTITKVSDCISKDTRKRNVQPFASIDPLSYGLRVPNHGDRKYAKKMSKEALKQTKHLVPRPALLRMVALAKQVGNLAAAQRLMACLLDLEYRCRFMDDQANDESEKNMGAIQTRVAHEVGLARAAKMAAMDVLQELTMRIPGGAVATGYASTVRQIHDGMSRRLRICTKRWYWSKEVRMAAEREACDYRGCPVPIDETGIRSHMTFI